MLVETIDAERENDASYLCWQKVWRMLVGRNHTVESTYLNMESTIAYRTFRSSSEFAPEIPDASTLQVPRIRREKKYRHDTVLTTFWAVYPKLQAVVVDGSLLL